MSADRCSEAEERAGWRSRHDDLLRQEWDKVNRDENKQHSIVLTVMQSCMLGI